MSKTVRALERPSSEEMVEGIIEVEITFLLDHERGRRRSNWRNQQSKAVSKSRLRPDSQSLCVMEKDGAYYSCIYDVKEEQERLARREQVPRSASVAPLDSHRSYELDFDPMKYSSLPGNSDLAGHFLAYDRWHREGKDLSHISIEREGDIVTLESQLTPSQNPKLAGVLTNRYVMDVSKGCVLVAYDSTTKNPAETWSSTYRFEHIKVKEIWVPKRIVVERADTSYRREERTEFVWIPIRSAATVDGCVFSRLSPDCALLGSHNGDDRRGESLVFEPDLFRLLPSCSVPVRSVQDAAGCFSAAAVSLRICPVAHHRVLSDGV